MTTKPAVVSGVKTMKVAFRAIAWMLALAIRVVTADPVYPVQR